MDSRDWKSFLKVFMMKGHFRGGYFGNHSAIGGWGGFPRCEDKSVIKGRNGRAKG